MARRRFYLPAEFVDQRTRYNDQSVRWVPPWQRSVSNKSAADAAERAPFRASFMNSELLSLRTPGSIHNLLHSLPDQNGFRILPISQQTPQIFMKQSRIAIGTRHATCRVKVQYHKIFLCLQKIGDLHITMHQTPAQHLLQQIGEKRCYIIPPIGFVGCVNSWLGTVLGYQIRSTTKRPPALLQHHHWRRRIDTGQLQQMRTAPAMPRTTATEQTSQSVTYRAQIIPLDHIGGSVQSQPDHGS